MEEDRGETLPRSYPGLTLGLVSADYERILTPCASTQSQGQEMTGMP
jgi:hypothetical protein